MAGERQRFGAILPASNDDDAFDEAGEEEAVRSGKVLPEGGEDSVSSSSSSGEHPPRHSNEPAFSNRPTFSNKPTWAQTRYLIRGLKQPGGKLPLFDEHGQEIDLRTIRSCIERGWAEPWFKNPIKKDWLVCKLTAEGYRVLGAEKPKG